MKTFYALYMKDNELDRQTRFIGKFETKEQAENIASYYFKNLGPQSISEGLFSNQWIISREHSALNLGLIQEENH